MARHYRNCPNCGEKIGVASIYWKTNGSDNILCPECRFKFEVKYTEEDKKLDDEENAILDEVLRNLKFRQIGGE